jgi:hypothetical protein
MARRKYTRWLAIRETSPLFDPESGVPFFGNLMRRCGAYLVVKGDREANRGLRGPSWAWDLLPGYQAPRGGSVAVVVHFLQSKGPWLTILSAPAQ